MSPRWACLARAKQAETQLTAVCTARSIRQAFVYSRDAALCRDFAERMSRELNARAGVAPSPSPPRPTPREAAVSRSWVTCTTAKAAVLEAGWLSPGACVAAVGSNALNRTELDVGDRGPAQRSGLRQRGRLPARGGRLRRRAGRGFVRLGQSESNWAMCSRAAGRWRLAHGPDRVQIGGMAIEDLAVAAHVLARVRQDEGKRKTEANMGRLLSIVVIGLAVATAGCKGSLTEGPLPTDFGSSVALADVQRLPSRPARRAVGTPDGAVCLQR